IVSYFDEPAVSVMKHLNPSGVAVQLSGEGNATVYRRAREADPRAAFGSVVVFNSPVDMETAKEIMSTYVEVVYAPDFQRDALPVFEAKKDIRIGKVRKIEADRNLPPDIVVLDDGSVILEDPYKTRIRSLESLKQLPVPTKMKPCEHEYRDLLRAGWGTCEVRSNALVLWQNGASLAIRTGQQARVGTLETGVEQEHRYGRDLKASC